MTSTIVSAILGILVQDRQFRKQKTFDYLQKQTNVYYVLYYQLAEWTLPSSDSRERFMGRMQETNTVVNENVSLLDTNVVPGWFDLQTYTMFAPVSSQSEKYLTVIKMKSALSERIRTIVNEILIPEYRKVCGETVPLLSPVEFPKTAEPKK